MYFFIIASVIFLLMHLLVGGWFYWVFPQIGWKIPLIFFPLSGTLFMRWAMVYTRTHYGTLESLIYYTAYIWAGLIFLSFAILLIFWFLQGLCALCHLPAKHWLGYSSMAVLIAAAILSLYGGFQAPVLRYIDIDLPNAPQMTLAVISDAHLGEGVSLKRFEQALLRIRAEQPDGLLILGDLFEYGRHPASYAQALRNLQTPLGSYGVLGNHEYYMGYQNSVNFYQQAGITLLQNEIVWLPNGVELIGINDIKTTKLTAEKLDQLLDKTTPDMPRILLSHQPALVSTVAAHNIPLMLSGHTHAGQIWPFHYLVKLVYPHMYGLYQTGPDTQLYVTSGMFYWGIPMRLFAPAEIPILRINYEK